MTVNWSLLVSVGLSASGLAPEKKIDGKGLVEDLALLKRVYQELHPGLYRYNTEADIDRRFAALAERWRKGSTLEDAYLSLSELLATIRCGHTYANFYNQEKSVVNSLFDRADRVPFTFRWLGNSMVVTQDFSAARSFPRGTEILQIDGHATADVLNRLLKYTRADGHNDAKRVAQLAVTGLDKYEAFDIFFSLTHPQSGNVRAYRLKRPGSTRTIQVSSPSITSQQRKVTTTDDPTDWSFTTPNGRDAVLRMPGWAMYNSKWNWKAYLRDCFKTLDEKKYRSLVIDIRGNEGGDSVGDEIIRHLLRQPVQDERGIRYTKYRKVPDDLRPFLRTWDKSFNDWGAAATPASDGFFKLTRFDDPVGTSIQPAQPVFLGKVFVLIGPDNSSATFEFASRIKQMKLGTLVGQPTGGNQRGINGGAFFFLTLPNSKIEVDVPLIGQFLPGNRPDAGITPDVQVPPSASDIAFGRDPELAKAIKLAGG